jgi:hypothetical protein
MTSRRLDCTGTASREPIHGHPFDLESIEHRRVQVGLVLWAVAGLERRAQVAGAGRGDEFAAAVLKVPSPTNSQIETAGGSVTDQDPRAAPTSGYMYIARCSVDDARASVEGRHIRVLDQDMGLLRSLDVPPTK